MLRGKHDGRADSPGYLRIQHRTADGGECRGQGQPAGHAGVQFRSHGVWQRDQLRPLPRVSIRGLITSLARPGGNVTGSTWDVSVETYSAKRPPLCLRHLSRSRRVRRAARRLVRPLHRSPAEHLPGAALLDCTHDVQPRGCGGQYEPQALLRFRHPGRLGHTGARSRPWRRARRARPQS